MRCHRHSDRCLARDQSDPIVSSSRERKGGGTENSPRVDYEHQLVARGNPRFQGDAGAVETSRRLAIVLGTLLHRTIGPPPVGEGLVEPAAMIHDGLTSV